ncbi:CAZyme family GT34 [Paecilomyces variotii]|uniref:Putative alpha-1,6-mannosyltransferase subunit n=1 Tax=Byssochlamys spectabilis TaxID=264951 RepID=A0A443I3B4_BYSSP|nr:putative alpha-1,6-mannosyltransferase subunit [Paecilomyces variotii]KAJ9195592.1 CAZyme family GT34 [Paecilomyces variotii]KAJ9198708.1 CAZyme family GT34 [Paecilomyces variotii]KAJ9224912.1 CAZyme family GT34 [Paecilomyces variotii]KAJ9262754.1 CAZyme family GT34 [Paecilomyces variotii]KAJ9277469.1 CAZyme family GT34 [Paecilomyces variotii]
MSLSRSPSPHPGGGWSSPGLTPNSGSSSPRTVYSSSAAGPSGISWAAAKAKSEEVKGYPSFSTRNNGFFSRQKRRISASLPRFRLNSNSKDYREKEKLGRGRWQDNSSLAGRVIALLGALLRRTRIRLLLVGILIFIGYLMFWTSIFEAYRRSSIGGGRKVVIILASNVEGGVMEWKGAREWAIERNSIANKKRYAKRWGYNLEIVNMMTKKRYAHEWRESWEKVDVIRDSMRKYPQAEWFWWLDLNTYIMEYSYSLEDHLLNHLDTHTYRDINVYNPLNITHPLTAPYLDPLSRSVNGDGDPSSINLLVPQDCAGFNLGSFLVRRSSWTDRLLDIWWDPVMYEQKHMEWEHKEQDSLEYLYANQPWVRPHVSFVPQRRINSFPPGACGDEPHPGIHYHEKDRDFVVNMAGCEWGRDCWVEMYNYRELSNHLNRTRWERFKDGVSSFFKNLFGKTEKSATQ